MAAVLVVFALSSLVMTGMQAASAASGPTSVVATTDKSTYLPGQTITITWTTNVALSSSYSMYFFIYCSNYQVYNGNISFSGGTTVTAQVTAGKTVGGEQSWEAGACSTASYLDLHGSFTGISSKEATFNYGGGTSYTISVNASPAALLPGGKFNLVGSVSPLPQSGDVFVGVECTGEYCQPSSYCTSPVVTPTLSSTGQFTSPEEIPTAAAAGVYNYYFSVCSSNQSGLDTYGPVSVVVTSPSSTSTPEFPFQPFAAILVVGILAAAVVGLRKSLIRLPPTAAGR